LLQYIHIVLMIVSKLYRYIKMTNFEFYLLNYIRHLPSISAVCDWPPLSLTSTSPTSFTHTSNYIHSIAFHYFVFLFLLPFMLNYIIVLILFKFSPYNITKPSKFFSPSFYLQSTYFCASFYIFISFPIFSFVCLSIRISATLILCFVFFFTS